MKNLLNILKRLFVFAIGGFVAFIIGLICGAGVMSERAVNDEDDESVKEIANNWRRIKEAIVILKSR